VSTGFERNTPRALHREDPPELARVVAVLVGTSHPGNVGSAARALRTMGLSRLRLVNPRFHDITNRPEAIAFASGATQILAQATIHDTLSDALADCVLGVAISAEPREFGPLPQTPEDAAQGILSTLRSDPEHQVALVFGAERTGLSIEEVQRCGAMLSIPGHPQYSSLNLAQAVQIVAYVLRREALGESQQPAAPTARLAEHAAVQGLIEHLEQTLLSIGFLDPDKPRKLMPRLARFIHRSRPSVEEVDLLRGICKATQASVSRKPD
jgi:tRNA/rRNA methyltransferase